MKCKIGFEDGEFLFMTKPETEHERKLMYSCFDGKPLDSFEAIAVVGPEVSRKDKIAMAIIIKEKE